MDSEYEAFITAQSRKKYPAPASMLSAIKSLLADPSTPPSAAAREAVSCYIQETNPDPDYTSLWPLLFATIGKFTDQNDRLVDFIAELHSLTECNGAFSRLDGLSEYMTEFVFDYQLQAQTDKADVDHPYYDPQRDEKRQAWVNVNSFAAKLYARGIRANHVGHLRHGGWVLRKTLEKAPWEKVHHEDIEQELEDLDNDDDDEEYCELRDHLLEEIDIRTLNGWVPAAAQWIRHCGREIYAMEGSMGREFPTKWTGSEGWSKERWAFWKERFEWVSLVTALDRKTRRIAKETVQEMARIEQGQD
ncbi:DUF3632 domain-containing protein [Aspergillus fischeri NRRL 181]|uniref:Uncharacterized protein n=1 Tax=Neosartorya fischeri (strain ATCC 1020 / DSM 3700 / CBS 544.65 / FGSC A1164 / JCM 1740 / NRRL 181 / WB 181) TaxID=331117 RepID=A1D5F0_NEOFI|nr:uncharacterized protein NFIA_023540 [Aspergillus fischeri NRRL 181]EAW23643.1 hypothetical protein NFIA_023540 [Aspergillus fischeri NRRL 181]KAG2027567.1 hypothetical protein GB937_000005 [Aspergillus fischeri]